MIDSINLKRLSFDKKEISLVYNKVGRNNYDSYYSSLYLYISVPNYKGNKG